MPSPFLGQLNKNEIRDVLYNMIISIQTEAANIHGTFASLVDAARVDGGLYGDTKIYIDTDILESHPWGNDGEAGNLLDIDRGPAPSTQYIVMNIFRQIRLTIDDYLSKRAFYNEGEFASFNAVLLNWLYDTKRVLDSRIYNSKIGTMKSSNSKENLECDLTTIVGSATGIEKARLRGQGIAEFIANLLVELRDASKDFNSYKYMRSHDLSNIKVIWNAKYLNEITKVDMPTIFHAEGLVDKMSSDFLPKKYFGTEIKEGDTPDTNYFTVDSSAHTATVKNGNDKVRNLLEVNSDTTQSIPHQFPADLVPDGTVIALDSSNKFTSDVEGKYYIEDEKVICKICTVLPPFLSAFSVGTKFVNPRSLTENNYLTYGYNKIEFLKGKPYITIVEQ